MLGAFFVERMIHWHNPTLTGSQGKKENRPRPCPMPSIDLKSPDARKVLNGHSMPQNRVRVLFLMALPTKFNEVGETVVVFVVVLVVYLHTAPFAAFLAYTFLKVLVYNLLLRGIFIGRAKGTQFKALVLLFSK